MVMGHRLEEAAADSLAPDPFPPKTRQKRALGFTPSETKEAGQICQGQEDGSQQNRDARPTLQRNSGVNVIPRRGTSTITPRRPRTLVLLSGAINDAVTICYRIPVLVSSVLL